MHMELIRTRVGFFGSMELPESRYPAEMTPRWGTWTVLVAAMILIDC